VSVRLLYVTPYGFDDRLRNFPEFVIGRRLAKEGWDVSACTLTEAPCARRERVDGITVHRLRGPIDRLPRLALLFLRHRPELVHVFHLRNPLAVPATLLARALRVPLVFSEPGLLHDPFLVRDRDDPLSGELSPQRVVLGVRGLLASRGPQPVAERLRSFLYHLPLAAADRVIFLSRHNLDVASRIGLDGASWLPCVVDAERWREAQPGLLDPAGERNVPDGAFALWVGQLKLRKGWDLVLRAIPEVPRSVCPAFVFVSPTHPEMPPHFRRQVEALGIADRVRYLSRVPNSVLLRLYRDARAVLIPSRYEGFGLPMLEAFETGAPVVATDVPAINEIVRHGENGYLVAPGDPSALASGLVRVLADEALRRRMVEGGRATLESHRVEQRIGEWIALYREVRDSRA
jgi:glycosyltransferase involved in cell wall biosynthesis